MSYANRDTLTITIPAANFVGAGVKGSFKLPKNKQGRLLEVMVLATTAFTATTTEAFLNIGKTDGGAEYAKCALGTTAQGKCYNMTHNDKHLVDAGLPADEEIFYATTAPTGGSPGGVGTIIITIGIF